MKNILGPIVGAALIVSVPGSAAAQQPAAQSDEAAKLSEARAVIDVMFPPAERHQMVDRLLSQISDQFRKAMPSDALADPGVKAIVDESLDRALQRQSPLLQKHMPEILDATAVAYTHEFSLAELRDIHAFGQTAAGRHYLSRANALIGDPAVAKANMALIAEAQQLSNTMMGELKDKLTAYLKAHPDVAAKLQAKAK